MEKRVVGTVQDDPKMLRFVNSVDGSRLAGARHFVSRSFPAHEDKTVFVDWDPPRAND